MKFTAIFATLAFAMTSASAIALDGKRSVESSMHARLVSALADAAAVRCAAVTRAPASSTTEPASLGSEYVNFVCDNLTNAFRSIRIPVDVHCKTYVV
ncbi:hypothetical protein CYLTODRAFT_443195, partial [Cylindrobasidium torrendii FP15055 ss-10]